MATSPSIATTRTRNGLAERQLYPSGNGVFGYGALFPNHDPEMHSQEELRIPQLSRLRQPQCLQL